MTIIKLVFPMKTPDRFQGLELEMYCPEPKYIQGHYYPCGKCLICRAKRRRAWVGRMLLECEENPPVSMWTLTYDEDHVPTGEDGRNILRSQDLTDFLKRARKHLWEHWRVRFRFFAVGEYGKRYCRPHFHIITWGIPPECHRAFCSRWSAGFVSNDGHPTNRGLAYVAGYVSKKMQDNSDPRVADLPPEYAVMSMRPGIGTQSIKRFAEAYTSGAGRAYLEKHGDVCLLYKHQDRTYVLDQTMAEKLREAVGVPLTLTERGHRFKFVVTDDIMEKAKKKLERMQRLFESRSQRLESK